MDFTKINGVQDFRFHSSPVLTRERFAEAVGVSPEIVRGWIQRGLIPTIKIGRHRLINVHQLTAELN